MARPLFFHNMPSKFMENIHNKQIFTKINISFFNLFPQSFLNQQLSMLFKLLIRNNIVYVVACRVIVIFRYELTKGRCNFFQHIFRNQKKSGFLRPKFPDYVISCDYDLTHSTQVA